MWPLLTQVSRLLSAINLYEAIHSFWYLIFDILAYLLNPPPSSWVSKVSSALRMSALLLILPWAFLIFLDITSYLVARALGIDTTHRHDLPPQKMFDGDELMTSMEMLFGTTSEQSSPAMQVESHVVIEDGSSGNNSTNEDTETTILLRKRTRLLTTRKEYDT